MLAIAIKKLGIKIGLHKEKAVFLGSYIIHHAPASLVRNHKND